MTVADFIEKYVEKNTLMRLHTVIAGGHEELGDVQMEWELTTSEYADREIIGVIDIVCSESSCFEAVNLVVTDF